MADWQSVCFVTLLAIFGGSGFDRAVSGESTQPELIRAVGQVLELRPERNQAVQILRADGRSETAHPFDLLYAGDAVQVMTAGTSVVLFDIESRRSRRITSENGRQAVGGLSPAPVSEAAAQYMRLGFNALFSAPRKPVPVETEARSATTALRLTADPLLPVGPQNLPSGLSEIALLWHGGGAEVRLTQGSVTPVVYEPPGTFASTVLHTAPLAGEYRLIVGRSALTWSVAIVEPSVVPEPTWSLGRPATNESERVVRAAWLLCQGPTNWHLFGISEIAVLSSHNYVAERLWQAIRAGDFPCRQRS